MKDNTVTDTACVISTVFILYLLFFSPQVKAIDYTGGNIVPNSCDLFAKDAVRASWHYTNDANLSYLLDSVSTIPDDTDRDRIGQAIQFVWKNQIRNSMVAYTVAMGACLSPRKLPPSDDPLRSYRSNAGYF